MRILAALGLLLLSGCTQTDIRAEVLCECPSGRVSCAIVGTRQETDSPL
jgi:hypothetical protein